VRLDLSSSVPVRISLTQRIPPIEPPADTKYVKHLKFKSEILSKWWGHDMYLGAVVVLPEGFDEHPNAHYPVVYNQGHFPRTFSLGEPGAPSGRGGQAGASGSPFYQDWVSGKLGRFIIVLMQHPTPFYDDSYAVNSANNGPYGDALTQELMPLVEKRFRAIAEPWARTLYGGSTGGWESLAWQIFYPDMFNGTWTFCPDPVDFRYFQMVNIYQDNNAFYPTADVPRGHEGSVLRRVVRHRRARAALLLGEGGAPRSARGATGVPADARTNSEDRAAGRGRHLVEILMERMSLFLDAKTHVEVARARIVNGPDGAEEMVTEMRDYRAEGGTLVAHQIGSGYVTYKINETIDPTWFAKPR